MDSEKTSLLQSKKELLFGDLALIIIGILFVVSPESSSQIICYATGGLLCLLGIINTVIYFKLDAEEAFGSFKLALGATLLILGIAIFIKPQFLGGILTSVFGIILMITGVFKLQYSIDLLRMNAGNWWTVLILSFVMIVLGLVVILNPFKTVVTLMIFTGIVLIINGLSDMISVFYLSKVIKQAKIYGKKAAESIDADHIDI